MFARNTSPKVDFKKQLNHKEKETYSKVSEPLLKIGEAATGAMTAAARMNTTESLI